MYMLWLEQVRTYVQNNESYILGEIPIHLKVNDVCSLS